MPNYNNGKVYCIRSHQTDQIYIGSTTQKLCRRMTDHRRDYKRWLKGKYHYMTSFEIIKLGDAYVELLELCPCSCKEELHKVEGGYIRKMKCVNKYIPCRTKEEYHKEYRKMNKGIIAKKREEYYERNKDKILKQMKKYRKMNKEKIAKQYKEYCKKNKDKIAKKNKEYWKENKDKINQKRREHRAKKKIDKMLSTGQ